MCGTNGHVPRRVVAVMPIFRLKGRTPHVIDENSARKLMKKKGSSLLVITRKPPLEIERYRVEYIWVTTAQHPRGVHPIDLYRMEHVVVERLKKGKVDILLDAVEYLMLHNGVRGTLKFIAKLRDRAVINNTEFYVTVSANLDHKVRRMIERIVE